MIFNCLNEHWLPWARLMHSLALSRGMCHCQELCFGVPRLSHWQELWPSGNAFCERLGLYNSVFCGRFWMLLPVPISQAVCNLAGTSKGRRQRPPGRFVRVAHLVLNPRMACKSGAQGRQNKAKTAYRDEKLLWEVFRSRLAKQDCVRGSEVPFPEHWFGLWWGPHCSFRDSLLWQQFHVAESTLKC